MRSSTVKGAEHMASTVSDTDLKLFLNLSNPEKTNRHVEEGEDLGEEDDEGEEENEEGYEDEEDGESEDGDDGDEEAEDLPDLSGGGGGGGSAYGGAARSAAGGASSSVASVAPAPVEMSREELDYAKTSVLLELERLRSMGCKLTREYGMHDSLEEMEYEARRHVLIMEEQNSVNMMKDGLRLFVSGVEFANGKFGPFLNLDGFSQSFSSELTTGKHNMTLTKLHRKYFKTPVQSAPEVELAMALMGAAAMHHFQRSYMHKVMPQQRAQPASFMPNVPAADDDSDEDLPPSFGT